MSGVEFAAPESVRVLTLTAPGFDVIQTADDLVAWNAGWSRRWAQVWRELVRAAPGAEFARVLELQKRGAIHLHVVVRGASGVSLRRVRRFATTAGFGPRLEWAPVQTPKGLSHYLAGYLAKSRDEFPPGTRVLETSRGWDMVHPESLVSIARRVFADVLAEVWYGAPPPGVGWWAFAEDPRMSRAVSLVSRRRRARDGLERFELTSRDRFARWLVGTRGLRAAARSAARSVSA